MTALLEADAITVRFGRVSALDRVSFAAQSGQVTCLLGDNGAGKTTLIRVLCGVLQPTEGEVVLDGQPIRFDQPRAARDSGIVAVHQDLGVIPLMSVWRNFFLGAEPVVGRWPVARINTRRCRLVTRECLREMRIGIDDVDRPLGTLSGGERQAVAIARALHFGARAIVLDEPTAALGHAQTEILLERLDQARARGLAIVLVTHNPLHAHALADHLVVLRRGAVAAQGARDQFTAQELIGLLAASGGLG